MASTVPRPGRTDAFVELIGLSILLAGGFWLLMAS
jgi:hypothetical protein